MLALITAGLAIGMLGSFHCIGMCGPLALSLPIKTDNNFTRFLSTFLYNAGRVCTYAFLGFLFGWIGRSMFIFGVQQFLSVIIGIIILLFLLLGNRISKKNISINWLNRFYARVRRVLGGLYTQNTFSAVFFIGLLNGLLPCGLVYMAIAGALATGDVISSMVFMAAFGLGTLPLMWSLAFFGNYISTGIRLKIRRIYPYALGLMACLLIVRGLGLGIPYLSPRLFGTEVREIIECM